MILNATKILEDGARMDKERKEAIMEEYAWLYEHTTLNDSSCENIGNEDNEESKSYKSTRIDKERT